MINCMLDIGVDIAHPDVAGYTSQIINIIVGISHPLRLTDPARAVVVYAGMHKQALARVDVGKNFGAATINFLGVPLDMECVAGWESLRTVRIVGL
jgi:hypothetical protein